MKLRYLSLVPLLLLSGCTNEIKRDNGKTYQNVLYIYSFEKYCYEVSVEEKSYYVPLSNFHEISVYSWKVPEEYKNVENEYFVSTNELFVYIRLQWFIRNLFYWFIIELTWIENGISFSNG